MLAPSIRDAGIADLPRLLAIANEAITHTTANWDDEPVTLEARAAWLEAKQARGLPVLVADCDGDVAGYGTFGAFRPFAGYRHTVEHALYVDPRFKRRGLGAALLSALERRARALDLHAMVGAVAAENEASLALHRAAGFVEAGRLPQVGRKFGRWLDLVLVQKLL